MTVAVAVKVFDGLVLAADSATTISLSDGSHQVYNNANKVFHLHRKHPIAAMTWGLGNMGGASISTLAKDLRQRFMGVDSGFMDWALDESYTVGEVAARLVEYFYPLYEADFATEPNPPFSGFLIAGYGPDARQPEAWRVDMATASAQPVPVLEIPEDVAGWAAYAQPEATLRLFRGIDPGLHAAMIDALPVDEMAKIAPLIANFNQMPIHEAMPLGDAISFAKFMVEVTSGYRHFLLGPDTVGGPVEVASLSRHEGFKWISRKHYYSQDLNPEGPSHAC